MARFHTQGHPYSQRGFTLIELLVVISIIGMLSSVVLAALGSARTKAKDAAIRQELNQFRLLVELDFGETGNYNNLQKGWSYNDATCVTPNVGPFAGNYAAQATALCKSIVAKTGTSIISGTEYPLNTFHTGNSINYATTFALMAWLPGKKTWLCVGSSGTSDILGSTGHTTFWDEKGCYSQP